MNFENNDKSPCNIRFANVHFIDKVSAVYDFNEELETGKLTWDTEGEVLPTGHLYNVLQPLHFLGGLVRRCVPMTKLSHNFWTTLYILSKDKTNKLER